MRKPALFLVALLLCAGLAGSARAGAADGTRARTVAVLPAVVRGTTPADVVRAVESALERALARDGTLAVSARTVSERLKGSAAVERCGSESSCLGRLAATLRVDAVAHTLIWGQDDGRARCDIRIVAPGGRTTRRAGIEVDQAINVDTALASALADLGGQTSSPATDAEAYELELVPLAPSPSKAAPVARPPDEEIAASAVGPRTTAAVAGTMPRAVAAAPSRSRAFVYTGAAVIAVGLGLLGTGAYHGLESRKIQDEINRKDENDGNYYDISQISAIDKRSMRDNHISRANRFFALSGVAAFVAAALITADVMWPRTPTLALDVRAEAPLATVAWTF